VRELENEIGCFFDRNPDGSLHGKAFAGQLRPHRSQGDLTASRSSTGDGAGVARPAIRRLESSRARLIPAADGVSLAGVLMATSAPAHCATSAPAVLLATGGGPPCTATHALR